MIAIIKGTDVQSTKITFGYGSNMELKFALKRCKR